MKRLIITLSNQEQDILAAISEQDMHYPAEQVRFMIREKAKRCGLLQGDTAQGAGLDNQAQTNWAK
jgi:hypothetical protein